MTVHRKNVGASYWSVSGADLVLTGLCNYLSRFFALNPEVVNTLGGTKASIFTQSQLDANFKFSTSSDVTVTAAEYADSNWLSKGWTTGNETTFVTELSTFLQNNYSQASINPALGDMVMVLTRGSIGGTDYTIPFMFFGNIGDAVQIPSTNLTMWLKADAITGLSNGNNVTTWLDSSSNANNATQGSIPPTYQTNVLNGLPSVRFTTNKMLVSTSSPFTAGSATAGYTFFAVIRSTLGGSNFNFIWSDRLGSGGGPYFLHENRNVIANSFLPASSVGSAPNGDWDAGKSNSYTSGTNVVLVAGYDRSNQLAKYYLNGVNQTPLVANFLGLPTGNLITSTSPIHIGNENNSGFGLNGDIYEMGFYSSWITDDERNSLTNYLLSKYGL